MELKTVQPVKVMCRALETTLKNIQNDVDGTYGEIEAAAQKLKLKQTGAPQWIYYGSDGNPDTKFTLEMAVPVNGEAATNDYKFKELPEFKCATMLHKGSWSDFTKTYEQLIGAMMSKGIEMSGVSREVYQTIDFDIPENNITEIQIGIL